MVGLRSGPDRGGTRATADRAGRAEALWAGAPTVCYPSPVLALPRIAFRSAIVACAAIAVAGLLAGAVRLLPWLLDPAVPWTVAAPFARGLVAVALEAAVLVGWPVGWALGAFRCVEMGEARVLLTLGERPEATLLRLVPQGAVFAALLGAGALVYGSDAGAPGRVATELVVQARATCLAARVPATYAIPFTDMTWLCAPGREPRLVGSGPGAMAGALLTARGARVAGDFRALELDDARVLLPMQPPLNVHVASLSLHGMSPWARASTLSAAWRAVLLVVTAWAAASLAAYAVALRRAVRGRLGAAIVGAVGPLAALGVLRAIERHGGAMTGRAVDALRAPASRRDRGGHARRAPWRRPCSRACGTNFRLLGLPGEVSRFASREASMGNIGVTEVLMIALVALLLFGAGRIADIGKGLGQGIKNFKQGLKEAEEIDKPKPRTSRRLTKTSRKRLAIDRRLTPQPRRESCRPGLRSD